MQKIDVSGDDPKKVDGIFVTLKDVNLFTTGLFGCEASAEESFHTALVRKQMTVLGKSTLTLTLLLILNSNDDNLYSNVFKSNLTLPLLLRAKVELYRSFSF